MVGAWSWLRGGSRALTAGLATAALVSAFAVLPSAAHASGCTDSWTNVKGGSWFTASNWSNNAPPTSTEEACITLEGTYTVELTGAEVQLKSLTLGGTAGTQTLAVGSSCSVNTMLFTTAGTSIGAQGKMTLTNGDGCGDSVTLGGPVDNAGTIASEPANGGKRTLQGNVTNTGTLAINTETAFNLTGTVLTNEGALDVANAKQLAASGGASVSNLAGQITGTGSGAVALSGTGTFTQGGGATSGSKPVIVDDAALSYTGTGEGPIALRGTSTLSGNLSAGQLLALESTCSENLIATASAGFSSAGSITLTNGDGCGDNATLAVSSGTLSNTGTIASEPANGGSRTLQGNITNTGTLTINANTSFANGKTSLLTNEGALDVANAKQLVASGGASVSNLAGQITAAGNGDVLQSGAGTFTQGGGATSGSKPVIVDDAALSYTGAGEGPIALRGTSTLSGNLSAGQLLALESTCSENLIATASAGFSSAGSITLTNGDGCGNAATLAVSSGTLTSTGTISSEKANGGNRTLQGNIANKGTLTINTTTAYNAAGAQLTNEGALDLAEGRELVVSNAGSVTNGSGGKIVATGTGVLSLGTGTFFTEGAGTISGTKPVILDDGSLTYSGSGQGRIALHGSSTLTGNLSAGQLLSVESTCGENATTSATSGLTNGGSVTLTNGDGCGNAATLTIPTGLITNSGTITTERANGGARTLQGDFDNTGTLAINANTSVNSSATTLANNGAINLATAVSLTVSNGETVSNEGGTIAATGTGALVQSGGTFNQGAGKTTGTEPVILDDLTLDYTGKGASTIALRGASSKLTGPINSGQTLSIQSTCSENATVSTGGAALSNSGTLVLTNGDGCGNSVTLALGAATLENKGALEAQEPSGGSRTLEGSITNEKTVVLGASANLKVIGGYSQGKKGTVKVAIVSAGSFGAMSVSGAAALAGNLTLEPAKTFTPALGNKFAIITAGSRTGLFGKVKGAKVKIKKGPVGIYYDPTYSATGVTLVVSQAKLVVAPTEGLPGSTVKLTGSVLPAEDKIKLTFQDAKKAKTTYTTVTTNASGEFSTEVAIPAGASLGSGTFTESSTATGVKTTATFKVT